MVQAPDGRADKRTGGAAERGLSATSLARRARATGHSRIVVHAALGRDPVRLRDVHRTRTEENDVGLSSVFRLQGSINKLVGEAFEETEEQTAAGGAARATVTSYSGAGREGRRNARDSAPSPAADC